MRLSRRRSQTSPRASSVPTCRKTGAGRQDSVRQRVLKLVCSAPLQMQSPVPLAYSFKACSMVSVVFQGNPELYLPYDTP